MKIYQRFLRDVLYPLVLLRRGDLAERNYLREFETSQFLSPDQIRALQWQRLRGLLDHAYRRCPFYKERFDAAGLIPSDLRSPDDLRALPVLEKSDIQDHRASMVARDWPADDLL